VGWFSNVNWQGVFEPHTPVLEILVRGTLVYIALFLLLRVVLRRQSGALGVTDLLVVVLIADAAQNAMAGDYRSVTDGVLLVGVIVGWACLFNWLGFRFPSVERLVKPPKLPLIEDGELCWKNMRRELVTVEELRSQLRLQGIDNIGDVRRAYMEPDGRISIVQREGNQHPPLSKQAF
jgi:uncharacterized membrane protein YcaP (DUF421 family)